ncbi:hypothetical protein KI387_017270, partial [Taxus chinensis]
DEEAEDFKIDHTKGARELLDSTDEQVCVYHVPLKTKKVNIRIEDALKKVIIGDY